ncbi:hypothetical protein LINPERPRIM_LOCUS33307 [Linum perenne]
MLGPSEGFLIQTLTIRVRVLSISHLVLEDGCVLGSRLV